MFICKLLLNIVNMSENTKIKLNLKWLQQTKTEISEKHWSLINTPETKNKNIAETSFKMKTGLHPPFRVERYIKPDLKNEQGRVKTDKDLWLITQTQEEESKGLKKMSFTKIAGKKEESSEVPQKIEEQNASLNTGNQETEWVLKNTEETEEEIQFTNYKSKFKDESENIIKRIRRFRYAPKTRLSFVMSIIVMTAVWISSMMVLFPDKHSFEIYRSSLLDIYYRDNISGGSINEDISFVMKDIDEWLNKWDVASKDDEKVDNQDITEKPELHDIDKEENEMYIIRNFLYQRYR